VYGPADDVRAFIADNAGLEIGPEFGLADGETRELPLSFSRALPTPRDENGKLIGEDMSYTETKDMPDYWYNWNINNWGTKWDLGSETHLTVQEMGVAKDKLLAFYAFETAWSPPAEWFEHVAPNYSTLSLKLEYREEGLGFAGHIGYHNGEEVERHEYHLSSDSCVTYYDDMYGGL
jgi:hypothetical protein